MKLSIGIIYLCFFLFFGFDIIQFLFIFMFLNFYTIFLGSYYIYIVIGLLLVSCFIAANIFLIRITFFSLIFMLVYSRRLLLLIIYINAIIRDLEVKKIFKFSFFLSLFIPLFLFESNPINVFNNIRIRILFNSQYIYLLICTIILLISLLFILVLLLKKSI